uniref:agamous-like MADS-box protein AGL62 n=1 Tax=Erigeron canadensis TaxID=72917 RepID=UPI001CB8ECD3|nr:agamous-like MADS-box protein AGL62 [Erigeron canadensis]
MKKKASKGRKKIEIKKIQHVSNLQVTFSKRRTGLFKKASELCVLTGAQIAILARSPGDRIYAFGHPSADVLIERYLNTIDPTKNDNNASSSDGSSTSSAQIPQPPVKEFNRHYMEVSKELEVEKKRKDMIIESRMVNNSGLPWYEEENLDGFDVDELEQYLSTLVEMKRKVLVRADELMMIQKTPAFLSPNMLDHIRSGPNMLDRIGGALNMLDIGGNGPNMMQNGGGGHGGYTNNDMIRNTMIPNNGGMPPQSFDFGNFLK